MTNIKSEIYINLVTKGRELVIDKGVEYLTARKLSEASGYSVGTIYNQFFNMDNFIIVQNMLTLDQVYDSLVKIRKTDNAYENINNYLSAGIDFVYKNSNLWSLLYEFHLRKHEDKLPEEYARRIVKVMKLMFSDFSKINPGIKQKERKILKRVLWLALFSLSPFLTNNLFENFNDVRRETACQLLLNTYLAGMTSLG
ncbi:MAG: TetR family transcriptional regulator [Lactobacillaceae bacterium]|jgi:AcrR family transcriptional regulator|nr:TetR family transcriptional regulator [Lactobacillaceae bacterium]